MKVYAIEIDGERLIRGHDGFPKLFQSRKSARGFIDVHFLLGETIVADLEVVEIDVE